MGLTIPSPLSKMQEFMSKELFDLEVRYQGRSPEDLVRETSEELDELLSDTAQDQGITTYERTITRMNALPFVSPDIKELLRELSLDESCTLKVIRTDKSSTYTFNSDPTYPRSKVAMPPDSRLALLQNDPSAPSSSLWMLIVPVSTLAIFGFHLEKRTLGSLYMEELDSSLRYRRLFAPSLAHSLVDNLRRIWGPKPEV